MKQLNRAIHSILNILLKPFKMKVIKLPRAPEKLAEVMDDFRSEPECACVYVGCGNDSIEGFIGSDLRPTETAQIVCAAWELSTKKTEITCIYSRHMVEHLTFEQALATFKDWHGALKVGGKVVVSIPNLVYHMKMYLELNPKDIKEWDFKLRKGNQMSECLAGLYGWQRESSPTQDNNTIRSWDIHKSGYTTEVMAHLLSLCGFSDINVVVEDEKHLVAVARKA